MQVSMKNILYLPLILFFFSAFAIWIPALNSAFLVFYFVLYIILFLLIMKDNKKFVATIRFFVKNNPLKYFAIILILMSLNSIILASLGFASFSKTLRYIILTICLQILPMMGYYLYVIKKYISYDRFIKFFLVAFWINLILGFISYLGSFFQLDIINNIFDFFANSRILSYQNKGVLSQTSNFFAFGLPRLDNLQQEPSFYGKFLYVFLPFVYAFSLNKLKLYNNNLLNCIIKKTLIPFTWISIILTFSPIYLILSSLITIIYFFDAIWKIIKKYNIALLIVFCGFLTVILNLDLSGTYLERIINVLTQIKTFDDFILVEPSLATRIVSYINQFCIFLKHPFTGIGAGNISIALLQQFPNSPVSLTADIIRSLNYTIGYGLNSLIGTNSSFVYTFLAENGIFIFSILVYFYFKLMKTIKRFIKQVEYQGFDFILLNALYKSYIALIIIAFYHLTFSDQENIFFISITVVVFSVLQEQMQAENILIQQGDKNEKY